MTDWNTITLKEVKQMDIEYLKKVLSRIKYDLEWNSDYAGWTYKSEKTIVDYIYEEENTILNPKELEGEIDKLIENYLNFKL